MTEDGYSRLHPVPVLARADMLESVAGLSVAGLEREFSFAVQMLDLEDVDSIRWLVCLLARRVGELEGAAEEIRERLEFLRGELRAERISMSELHELQGLAEHIDAGDVELLEAAGVPEFPGEVEPGRERR